MDNYITKTKVPKETFDQDEQEEDEEHISAEERKQKKAEFMDKKSKSSTKWVDSQGNSQNVNKFKRKNSPDRRNKIYAVVALSLKEHGGAGIYYDWEEAEAAINAKSSENKAKVKSFTSEEDAHAWIKQKLFPKDLNKGTFVSFKELSSQVSKKQKK